MYLTTTSQIILNHLQAQFDSTFRNPTELDNLIGQVYNKDVVEYLSLFPDESVDLILTDEPYGVAETRLNLKSRKDITSDFEWDKLDESILEIYEDLIIKDKSTSLPRIPMHLQNSWVYEASRILKPTGFLVNFGMSEFTATFRDVCRDAGLIWRTSGPWIKTNVAPHFRKTNFRSGYEVFWFASKGKTKGIFNFQEQQEMVNWLIDTKCPKCDTIHPVIFSNNYDKPKWMDDWVEISPIHMNRVSHHGTEKPPWLLTKFLTIFSDKDSLVVDPFAGSGSTAIAAHKLGRSWATNDLTEEWYQFVKARMESAMEDFV